VADEGVFSTPLESLCPPKGKKIIIVDVDQTAVKGNFVKGNVAVHISARDGLNELATKYYLIYLSANFKFKEMKKFFEENGYPQAPIFSRGWIYIDDYTTFCRAGYPYEACEAIYKTEIMKFIKDYCGYSDRWIGLGDKFSDYVAYIYADACPIIVDYGNVFKVNAAWGNRGCRPSSNGKFYRFASGPVVGTLCPIVPQKFIKGWHEIIRLIDKYMSGEVECGAW